MDREAIERQALEAHGQGRTSEAAGVLVRGFGPELLSFLSVTLRDPVVAEDVFSTVCEQILRGLPGFQGRSSLRTWCYTIARNAANQQRQANRRRSSREVADEGLSAIAAKVRTETSPFLRTEAKSKMAALRDALPEEDRQLLVLRVDKRMSWDDIASIFLGEDPASAADARKREAARLRKRFQLVKERLLAQGREAGLVGDD